MPLWLTPCLRCEQCHKLCRQQGLQTSYCMCCSSEVHVFSVNAMSMLLGTMSHAVRAAGAADQVLHALSS